MRIADLCARGMQCVIDMGAVCVPRLSRVLCVTWGGECLGKSGKAELHYNLCERARASRVFYDGSHGSDAAHES